MTQPSCPCGSDPLDDCCGRYHQGHPAPTAEALMRSRYSAYALGLVDYLRDTTLPAQQAGLDLDGIRAWSHGSTWLGLEVETTRCSAASRSMRESPSSRAGTTPTGNMPIANVPASSSATVAGTSSIRPWPETRPQRSLPCGAGGKLKKCCGPWIT